MNKLILTLIIITAFTLFSINSNINAEKYGNNYEYKINDYIFFPSHWMHIDMNWWFVNYSINPLSNNDDWFNAWLYDILYKKDMFYNNSKESYKTREYKRKLFTEIFYYEYNYQKLLLAEKDTSSDYITEYKDRDLELEKEINLAKLRYDNSNKAELDYQDITKDIREILEIYFNNLDIKLANLIKKDDNYKDSVCWVNLRWWLNFETNALSKDLENKNIKEYYIFWLDNSWSAWSPIWKNYAPAIIIKNKTDLENIDKTKYFVKKVNPEFFMKEVKDKFYEAREYEFKRQKATLEVVKEYSKTISKNKELKINISQEELIEYLDSNKYLYKSEDWDYAFWEWNYTTKLFTFILLWVDKNNNIINLSSSEDYKIDVSNNNYWLEQECDRYYSSRYNHWENKEYTYLVDNIENVFKKLDNKLSLNEYYEFVETSRYTETNSEFNITLEERKKYNAYLELLNTLRGKLDIISLKNNNSINLLLNKDLEYIISNKNKLNKLFLKKELLSYIDFISLIREDDLENILGIKHEYKHDIEIMLTK